MSTPKPKAKRGRSRAAFRERIEARLTAMGYPRSRYVWQDAPARLLMIIGDEMKPFTINAGKSAASIEYEMGRLATWAEVLRLVAPDPVAVVAAKEPAAPRAKVKLQPLANGQIDLEEAIAASHAPARLAHVGA